MSCSRDRRPYGPMELSAPSDYELKQLTDEEMKETLVCYCDRCGTQLRMHILFPRVGGLSLEHACVAKPPIVFEVIHQEFKPMEMPSTKIFEMTDYLYKNEDIK